MKGYIYYIINLKTQERYVGKTIRLEERKRKHFNQLKNNSHINSKLQNAWNKYGEENFVFEFNEYELVDEKELNQYEIEAIRKYNSYYKGYNLTLGGDGGNTRGKISFEDYCFIYIGCQWQGYTEKIAKFLSIDASTVSAILREKSYSWYKEDANNLPQEEKERIIKLFRQSFGIKDNKPFDKDRIRKGLTEDEYYYSLCISSCYGRGIDQALANFFGKHKSFLANSVKGKTKGKAYEALQRFKNTSQEEVENIAEEKFKEWNIQSFANSKLERVANDRWRN